MYIFFWHGKFSHGASKTFFLAAGSSVKRGDFCPAELREPRLTPPDLSRSVIELVSRRYVLMSEPEFHEKLMDSMKIVIPLYFI